MELSESWIVHRHEVSSLQTQLIVDLNFSLICLFRSRLCTAIEHIVMRRCIWVHYHWESSSGSRFDMIWCNQHWCDRVLSFRRYRHIRLISIQSHRVIRHVVSFVCAITVTMRREQVWARVFGTFVSRSAGISWQTQPHNNHYAHGSVFSSFHYSSSPIGQAADCSSNSKYQWCLQCSLCFHFISCLTRCTRIFIAVCVESSNDYNPRASLHICIKCDELHWLMCQTHSRLPLICESG